MLRPQNDCGTIYLYRKPVDMRKAINGLVTIVEGQRTLVKMVYWEGNGFALWMKRLEKNRFQ